MIIYKKIYSPKYLIIFLISAPCFAIHLGNISSPILGKLFKTYVDRTCVEKDCKKSKITRYDRCASRNCNEDYVTFEEAIIAKCTTQSNSEGCFSEKNFESAMCEESTCVAKITKAIVEKNPSFKENIESLRDVQMNSLLPPNGPKQAISSQDKSPLSSDIQSESIVKTERAYEASCQTKECLEKIEDTFTHIKKAKSAPKPSVQLFLEDPKLAAIEKDIVSTYVEFGPWSPEMFNLFKSKQTNESANKPKELDCSDFIDTSECKQENENGALVSAISNFFGKQGAGYALAEKLNRSGYRNEFSILCRMGFEEIPDGKRPLSKFFAQSSEQGSKSYRVSYRTASSKLECLSKFVDIEKNYYEILKKRGDFPSKKTFTYVDLGFGGQPYPVREFINGKCHAYIYIPTKDEEVPELEWFQDKSNKRLVWSASYENQNQSECKFKADRDLHKLNVNRFEEFIFFYGNIPYYKSSSKALAHQRNFRNNSRFYSKLYTSSPACRITFYTHWDSKIVNYDSLSLEGDCVESCENTKQRLKKANKDKDKNRQYKNLICTEVPNLNGGAMYGFEADIYNESLGDKQKVCEHYDYHWSKKPIRKFLAETKEECIGKASIWSVKNADEYIKYFGIKTNQYHDLEIKFDDQQVLRYSGEFECNLANYGGEVNKHFRGRTQKVKTKTECIDVCNEFKDEVTKEIRVSPVFIKCSMGRAPYNPLMLNHTEANPRDPFVAVKEGDKKSADEYFDEIFKEVWHGYPDW